MKNILFALFLILTTNASRAQTVFGKWKTIDDQTGVAKGIVEVYEKDGKVYGRILEILEAEHRNKKCVLCSDTDKNKPLLGFTFLKGLQKDGDQYNGGKIIDPENGKSYSCYITLVTANKLKVRGYLGMSLFGRTQYWYKVQ